MIDVKEIQKLLEINSDNIMCKNFCLFPSEIASYIDTVAKCDGEYGYILIGVEIISNGYSVCGINTSVNFTAIFQNAVKQSIMKTEIEQQLCSINNKKIWAIKVRTCRVQHTKSEKKNMTMDNIIKDLYVACIKLQGNSLYYLASEDQRNDYIRDIMETCGYNVKDQTRRGLSSTGKAAGELDIFIQDAGFPVTIIEALNLKSLDTTYLDKHINKIYDYDTAGNYFNVVLSYVTVINFEEFCNKYIDHIKAHIYPYSLTGIEENYCVDDNTYSDIKVMLTKHNRNGKETLLVHICVSIGKIN
ncbi:hypothetical protein [Clostridium sp.]|uniref:hypothetical protein n=1 Tax=Clostridium sp. TaxID=1506 RepID=UPI00262EF8DC|nr:hypothetical protein [Clostridium sp.]